MTDEQEDVADQVNTTSNRRGGPEPNEMAESFLPDEDHWVAKTQLDLEDPGRVAVLRQMGEIYPEVDDLQPVIDAFLDEFLPAKTSIGGQSREDAKEILTAMYGDHGSDDSKKGQMLMQAIGAAESDD